MEIVGVVYFIEIGIKLDADQHAPAPHHSHSPRLSMVPNSHRWPRWSQASLGSLCGMERARLFMSKHNSKGKIPLEQSIATHWNTWISYVLQKHRDYGCMYLGGRATASMRLISRLAIKDRHPQIPGGTT